MRLPQRRRRQSPCSPILMNWQEHQNPRWQSMGLMTLHESAETAEGDDVPAADRVTHGLHAKAYIAEEGWDTTLYLGSANATYASLMAGSDVEILADLRGKRIRVGGIDSFLGEDGVGE